MLSPLKISAPAGRQADKAFQHVPAVMQEIVVKVLRDGIAVDTFCFPDPPLQAALIKQALEEAGHKGVLQSAKHTYTSQHLLQHGAYTLRVSEAATGKSISQPSRLVTIQKALQAVGATPDDLTIIHDLLSTDGYTQDMPAGPAFLLLDAADYKGTLNKCLCNLICAAQLAQGNHKGVLLEKAAAPLPAVCWQLL